MAEREFSVICPKCGSEVSPYVTECPYCGNRVRKRAPDLKKQRQLEEREERRAEKQREKLRAQYEGGAGGGEPTSLFGDSQRPVATGVLVFVSIVASVVAASGLDHVSPWMLENLVLLGALSDHLIALVSAPFLQYSFGYGFVSLGVFALFGAGLEQRFGAVAPLTVWLICGALGVLAEAAIAASPFSYGAYAAAAGAFVAWTVVVVRSEDLRDYDAIGIGAIAFVICALPIATAAASVWSLIGGILGGLLCGAVLSRMTSRGVL